MLAEAMRKLDAALVASGLFGEGSQARVFASFDSGDNREYPACLYDITGLDAEPTAVAPGLEIGAVPVTIWVMTTSFMETLEIADSMHHALQGAGLVQGRAGVFTAGETFAPLTADESGGLYRLGCQYLIDPDGEAQPDG